MSIAVSRESRESGVTGFFARKFTWRWAALMNGFKDAIAYRGEFLIEIAGSAIVPVLIQLLLWYSIFKTGGHSEFAGKTYQELLLYTWVSALFSQVRGGNLDFELAEMIRTGTLSQYLLKPVSVLEFVFYRGAAVKLLVALVGLVAGIVVALVFGLSYWHILAGMLIAWMGHVIHYQISSVVASAAFAWEEAYGVLMVKNLVISLLSGELIPLYLVPEQYSWIWKSTPFYLYVYGPTQIATGAWGWAEFTQQVWFGLAWFVAGWILLRLTWGLGIRKYSSLGN